jgi:hypothetical protein
MLHVVLPVIRHIDYRQGIQFLFIVKQLSPEQCARLVESLSKIPIVLPEHIESTAEAWSNGEAEQAEF